VAQNQLTPSLQSLRLVVAHMFKYEIINELIRKRGYRRYLEICTPSTGHRFSKIDWRSLHVRHRLMYRCPANFNDRSEVTYRSETENIKGLIPAQAQYDMVFVDPWHTYDCSIRDLREGFARLRRGGTMIVHDCCPPSEKLVSPQVRNGLWCGLTYCAYVDFVLSTASVSHQTVDTDFGCGIVTDEPEIEFVTAAHTPYGDIAKEWFQERKSGRDIYPFFVQHKERLLNLVSAKDFAAQENFKRRFNISEFFTAVTLRRTAGWF
jgi:hypothetical protein